MITPSGATTSSLADVSQALQRQAGIQNLKRSLLLGAMAGAGLGGATLLGQYLRYSSEPPPTLTFREHIPVRIPSKKKKRNAEKQGAAVALPAANSPGLFDSVVTRIYDSPLTKWTFFPWIAGMGAAAAGYAGTIALDKLFRKYRRKSRIAKAQKEYERALNQVWQQEEKNSQDLQAEVIQEGRRFCQLLSKEGSAMRILDYIYPGLSTGVTAGLTGYGKALTTAALLGALATAYLGYKQGKGQSRRYALYGAQRERFEDEKEDIDQPLFYVD